MKSELVNAILDTISVKDGLDYRTKIGAVLVDLVTQNQAMAREIDDLKRTTERLRDNLSLLEAR